MLLCYTGATRRSDHIKAPAGGYVTRPEAVELLPGAARAIRTLNDAGIPVAVVTNQRCLARGQLDPAGLDAVHAAPRERPAAAAGAHVDAIYHCPHERDTCSCRKPAPGLLAAAARDFGAAPAQAVMIGDARSDVEAGRRFGARTIQLTAGPSLSPLVAPDLAA